MSDWETKLEEIKDKVVILREGANTLDATAKSSDIVSGKVAYVQGVRITGTMQIYQGEVID